MVPTAATVGSASRVMLEKICTGSVFRYGLVMNSATMISSKEVTKANSSPDRMPGAISGSVMVRKPVRRLAPRLVAAVSSLLSNTSRLAETAMMTKGTASIVWASTKPVMVPTRCASR